MYCCIILFVVVVVVVVVVMLCFLSCAWLRYLACGDITAFLYFSSGQDYKDCGDVASDRG